MRGIMRRYTLANQKNARAGWAIGLIALMAITLGPASAQTQADPANDKQPNIEKLLKRIEELEASQKQMQDKLDKLGAKPSSLAAADPAPVPAPPVQDAAPATAPEESEEGHRLGPVEFRGFTDFGYGRPWFEKLPASGLAGSTNSFNIGDFDLFTNTRISEHWNVLGELLITSDFSNEFGAELDRLMVTYTANDFLKISFGKYNTAVGYYPNAFHRAHFFQTGISRPVMFADEDNGGILPVHSIGISATGKIPSGALGLHWVAEVANGRAQNTDVPIQNFVDQNNGKALNFALYARPDWLPGFQTGVSVYRDVLHPVGLGTIGQTILSGHVVYVVSKMEWMNEAAIVRHAVQGGDVYRSLTSYTQLSRAFGKYRPYFRYDYQNVPATDPVFGVLGRMNGPSIGMLRNLSRYVILKAQYGRLSQRDLPSVNDFQMQLAIAF